MDPARTDDAQHRLERHALLNVRSLVEQLENHDLMDRRRQKKVVIGTVVFVMLVMGFFATQLTRKNPDEMSRCEIDTAVTVMWEKRAMIREINPRITDRELEIAMPVTDSGVRTEAKRICAQSNPPR